MSWKETDPLAVWKTSTIIPIGPTEAAKFEHTNPQSITSDRSKIWQSISELRGVDQSTYMGKLIKNWPYKWERRAFEMPIYAASFTNSWVSFYLANKLVAKAFYDHINVGFWETINRTTKAPFILAFYTGCLTTIGLWQLFVKTPMINEEAPSASRILVGSYASMVVGGVAMPLLTTPWIVHYIASKEGIGNVQPNNILEAFIINYKFSKPLFKLLPKIFAIQLVVASACVYSSLWARSRIFDTFEVEPDIIRKAISAAPTNTWDEWFRDKFNDAMNVGSPTDTSILEDKGARKNVPAIERFKDMFNAKKANEKS